MYLLTRRAKPFPYALWSLNSCSFCTGSKPQKTLQVVSPKGKVGYSEALALQRAFRETKTQNKREGKKNTDTLILLEHPPVYTLGKKAKMESLLFDIESSEWEVHTVERGGEVTYHGPGQLVAYTIFDLENHVKDLHWFLRQLEEVIISILGSIGIAGNRHPEYTGVWVGEAKIAAIGLSASRWITMHGCSINLNPRLENFKRIIPCGIDDPSKSVTSVVEIANALPKTSNIHLLEMQSLKERFVEYMIEAFQFEVVNVHDDLSTNRASFSYRPKSVASETSSRV